MFLCHTIPQGGIHLAGNQIARDAMFLHNARSPLLVVQEKFKIFNIGQAFETQLELHKVFTDSHFHMDKSVDKLKVNTLS